MTISRMRVWVAALPSGNTFSQGIGGLSPFRQWLVMTALGPSQPHQAGERPRGGYRWREDRFRLNNKT